MRHTAHRPLPALLAIVLLIGALCLVSMAMGGSRSHRVSDHAAADLNADLVE